MVSNKVAILIKSNKSCCFHYRGINLDQNLYMRKFRYNQVFHAVGADMFLKQLLNS